MSRSKIVVLTCIQHACTYACIYMHVSCMQTYIQTYKNTCVRNTNSRIKRAVLTRTHSRALTFQSLQRHVARLPQSAFICATCFVHTCVHSKEGHVSFTCGICFVHVRDVTHSHVDMTHSNGACAKRSRSAPDGIPYAGHDSFINETRILYMWDMTRLLLDITHLLCWT